MTEIAELVAAPTVQLSSDKCPFCNKSPHDYPAKTKDPDLDTIVSKPAQLKCKTISGGGPGKYSTAKHHMIPAIQCFKQVRRLAAMALSVGWDVNDPKNGIPLPTVRNQYTRNDGTQENFGRLTHDEKEMIRNGVMQQLGKQWHVGNHHYEIPSTAESTTEEMSDEGSLDHEPYDIVVVRRLLEILSELFDENLCEDDNQEEVKSELDDLCQEIKDKLNAFKEPKSSYPFYVSRAALQFADK